MPLSAGQSLSFYEILSPIGAGGMGEVYRARDTRLERDVAIKVLPDELAGDEERLRRFEREARTLACLSHPGVAHVYGIDCSGETNFIVMELVPGEDLAQRLARGALPLEEALDVCGQIAEGLEAAHEAGVIHRDLKPANVILTPEGRAKLLDFGLAKPIVLDAGLRSTVGNDLTTEAGRVLGTPGYMAPEHVRGKPIDKRVDVWAFGCVLYECLTGRQAFVGESLGDALAAVLEREPNWSSLPARLPGHVRSILARCLDKDPRTRLRDIGEVRVALGGWGDARDEPLAPRGIPARWGIGGLALGGLATFFVARALGPPEPLSNPFDGATWSRLTDFEGTEFDGCISPDGKWVSFVSDRDGPFDLFTIQVGTGAPLNRTKGSNDVWIHSLRDAGFTADSTEVWLAGGRGRRMKSMPLQGGDFRDILTKEAVNVDWTRDGRWFAYHTLEEGDPVYVASGNQDPGEPILVGEAGFHQHFPTWSFDDERIFLVRGREVTGDTDLWWIRPDGSDLQQLTRGLRSVRYPAPIDERRVVFVAEDRTGGGSCLWVLDLETGDVRRGNVGVERFTSVSASSDGRRLVATVGNPRANLWTLPIREEPVTEDDVLPLSDMPSLRALVPRFCGADLYYFSSRGTGDGLWRLRDGIAQEVWSGAEQPLLWPPSMSSDSRLVALVLPRGSRMVLNVLDTDGSGVLRPLAEELDVRGASSWSPDDEWIVIGGEDEDGPGLFKIPVRNPEASVVRLAQGEALNPVWSPRGDLIAYTGVQVNAGMSIRGVDPDGRSVSLGDIQVMVMRGGERYRFLPDGSGLVCMQGLNTVQDFLLLDLATMKRRVLADLKDTATMRTFDVSPDGTSIVFDREWPNSDIVLIELP